MRKSLLDFLKILIRKKGLLFEVLYILLFLEVSKDETFYRVLSPKVNGAWNLHRMTEGRPIDFFILFSSVASVFGSPGQGAYATGNAFLDSLAHYRLSRGLPALSINWGPWSEVGMAARFME
ncbi:KR domain-containing protein, partial [Paenibacillus polymyxa]|uniref:KR domain-containing protein n=1 Tax=Paenibacillus polymyxa TaxID=1406 RepID=UPI0010723F41